MASGLIGKWLAGKAPPLPILEFPFRTIVHECGLAASLPIPFAAQGSPHVSLQQR